MYRLSIVILEPKIISFISVMTLDTICWSLSVSWFRLICFSCLCYRGFHYVLFIFEPKIIILGLKIIAFEYMIIIFEPKIIIYIPRIVVGTTWLSGWLCFLAWLIEVFVESTTQWIFIVFVCWFLSDLFVSCTVIFIFEPKIIIFDLRITVGTAWLSGLVDFCSVVFNGVVCLLYAEKGLYCILLCFFSFVALSTSYLQAEDNYLRLKDK